MTNTRIILLGIFLAILLAILVLWCADVLAHIPTWESAHPGDPNPFGVVNHFCPNTPSDPCWGDEFCADGSKQYEGGHGHINEDGSWGYWGADAKGTWDDGTSPDCSGPSTVKPNPRTPSSMPRRSVDSIIPASVGGIVGSSVPITEEEIELEPQCESTRLQHFLWNETMLGLRVLPTGVDTIGELWDAWGLSVEKGNELYFYRGNWVKHVGDDPHWSGSALAPILANTGFVVTQTTRDLITFEGCPLDNADRIELQAGPNLIGFPKKPDAFDRPSDFLSDKVLWVTVQINGVYHEISQAGDTGDDPLKAGQAIIIESSEYHWVSLSAPSAPQAQRHGTLTTSWGRIKHDSFSR